MRLSFIVLRAYILILLVGCATNLCLGQIVNAEAARGGRGNDGWRGILNFSGSYARNVNEVINFQQDGRLVYAKAKNKYLLLSQYRALRVNEGVIADNGFLHLRQNHYFARTLQSDAFQQVQRARLQELRLRWLTGAGLRWTVWENDSSTIGIHTGLTYMLEFEQLYTPEPDHWDHRASAYLNVAIRLPNRLTVMHTTYFQPLFANLNDFRILWQTNVLFQVWHPLSFSVGVDYFYDSRPPIGVPKVFFTLTTGLAFRFGNP